MPSHPVIAAGGVPWRRVDEQVLFGVVHRPRYDDWSFPKGKLVDGELPLLAAVREVVEETGLAPVVGRRLPRISYPSPDGPKTVDYWAMCAHDYADGFRVNDETDAFEWLSETEARARLSHADDATLLADVLSLPLVPVSVLLVRHARAGKREEWSGPDQTRPLDDGGRAQARALANALHAFAPTRVLSADPVRCTQTVAPLAEALGCEVEVAECFSEEGYAADPPYALAQLSDLLAGSQATVVCSQGGVIPELIGSASTRRGVRVRVTGTTGKSAPARKGSVWALAADRGRLISADYYRQVSAPD